jgi:Ras-related protein Rab-18
MDSDTMNSSRSQGDSSRSQGDFDYSFKLLLAGDSGVGKSSLLLRFTSDTFDDVIATIGVDFKQKLMKMGDKRLKLTIWDTAGQEKFRTLTNSYYRGAHGFIFVYDVTRRETFTNLKNVWLEEALIYSTNQDCIKMVVGNKVDRAMDSESVVSKEEGIEFAKQNGCLFIECSAKTRLNVEQCFEELLLKILDTPSLLEGSTSVEKNNIFDYEQPNPGANDPCC